MLMPCEYVIKTLIPALRASIARKLHEDYDFTQVEIAEKLGLTQPAVNNYLSGRYSPKIKRLEKEVQKVAEKAARSIATRNLTRGEIARLLCNSCHKLLESRCKLSFGK